MPVRMRVNHDKESKCTLCGTTYMCTPEMHDLQFSNSKKSVIFTLCMECLDEIFHKTLKANCNYNSKIKNKEDMLRIRKSKEKYMPAGEKWTIEEKEPIKKKRGNKNV